MSIASFVFVFSRGFGILFNCMCLYSACVHVIQAHDFLLTSVSVAVICISIHVLLPLSELHDIVIEVGSELHAGVCIVDRSLFRTLLMMIGANLPTWSNMVPELRV